MSSPSLGKEHENGDSLDLERWGRDPTLRVHSLTNAGLEMASRLLAVSALNSGSPGKEIMNVSACRGSWGEGEILLLLSIPPSPVRTTTMRGVGDGEEGALYQMLHWCWRKMLRKG